MITSAVIGPNIRRACSARPAAAPPPRSPLIGLVVVAALLIGTMLGPPARAAPASPVPVAETGLFSWPLSPPHPVLRPFQPPATPYGPGHRGVDLGGSVSEAVLAAGDGLVLYAGPLADRSLVSVEHVGGLRTTYEPVQPAVRVGQSVRRGQRIGNLLPGHPGCPAGRVCLHWGVHRDRQYLDPLRLVEVGQIRLLPWPDHLSDAPDDGSEPP
ncbi:MAG TPA: M23 family metallopeptidase [Pseudonocardiaceae bacterium]|nr:M23 family metallopeptidase [Pseudonocardiaceae bacterium]